MCYVRRQSLNSNSEGADLVKTGGADSGSNGKAGTDARTVDEKILRVGTRGGDSRGFQDGL